MIFGCPCCGSLTLSERDVYQVCTVCGWEDDPLQSFDADLRGGANGPSLNEARAAWHKHDSQAGLLPRN